MTLTIAIFALLGRLVVFDKGHSALGPMRPLPG